jgi:hypothetical protein
MTSKPPSRTRYEAANPSVTFRVTLEELKQLRAMRTKTGLSLSELLRRNLGVTKTRLDETYDRGFRDGYGRFEVACSVCGEPMRFDIKKEDKARSTLGKAFSNWYHVACKE